MRILDLVLKGRWYDAIKYDGKREEYRDTYFWSVRLLNVDREGYGYFSKACRGDFEDLGRKCNDSLREFTALLKESIHDGIFDYRCYDAVRFHRGYTNITMLWECKGISIGMGNPLWGAPADKEVFIIKLGERI